MSGDDPTLRGELSHEILNRFVPERFEPDMWKQRWTDNRISWHSQNVHSRLKEHWDTFCPPDTRDKLVFVPLCGKTLDMRWMYSEKGCSVVGCDLSDKALVAFTSEHKDLNMEKTVVKFKNGNDITMFQTPDKRLRLYLCNIFEMDKAPESLYPLIWDRASLVAMDPSVRVKYINYLTSLATPKLRWLIETVDYPEGLHPGPPCRIPLEDFTKLFGLTALAQQYGSIPHCNQSSKWLILCFSITFINSTHYLYRPCVDPRDAFQAIESYISYHLHRLGCRK